LTFPALYHAHHSLHLEDLPFWLSLTRRFRGPVLELGCGTGRVLIPLAQAENEVYGLDNESGMLHVLKDNLSEDINKAFFFQADFTAFRLAKRFGLVFLACNTYSTLTSPTRRRLLQRALDHLLPGGAFAASLPNPVLLNRLPGRADPEIEEIFAHPIDGEPVQASSEWKRDEQGFHLQWHYDHLYPQGEVERLSFAVTYSLTSAGEYRDEILAAGFSDLKLSGDFDGSDYTPRSPHLILLALL